MKQWEETNKDEEDITVRRSEGKKTTRVHGIGNGI